MNKHGLRQELRAGRKQITSKYQTKAAQSVCDLLQAQAFFSQSQNIAVYLAFDGEVSMQNVIEYAWLVNKSVFLPILDPNRDGHLIFQQYCANSSMTKNKFGIPEPVIDYNLAIPPQQLDVICAPLVGFDKSCMRFGMGGGYYDRTLAKLHKATVSPVFVGIAHSIQELAEVPSEPWDIPMDYIVTEQKVFVRPKA